MVAANGIGMKAQQIPLDADNISGFEDVNSDLQIVRNDLAFRRLAFVNVVLVGPALAPDRQWTLIDAGIPGSASRIEKAAAARFGEGSRPGSIILTHGHFDHVGALKELAERWDVPVYAHPEEMRYLNGSESYPPPDPAAGGGLMTLLSPLFPRDPVDVRSYLQALPSDGSVPGMPGWSWLATPGHSPGHISLWREQDQTLIAGDAFITTAQESAYATLTARPEMHGPPKYFTPDWLSARQSVEKLAALAPELVITGHGQAMEGAEMLAALEELAARFDEVAVPASQKG